MGKKIVVYYSWSKGRRSAAMAETIAANTGAETAEIIMETPYSEDYDTCVRDSRGQTDSGVCPPITAPKINIDEYDTVYIVTPIWFGTIAPPVLTFINENNKLEGKTVYVYCTHGGGGKSKIDADMKKFCPSANVKEAFAVKEGGTEQDIISSLSEN